MQGHAVRAGRAAIGRGFYLSAGLLTLHVQVVTRREWVIKLSLGPGVIPF